MNPTHRPPPMLSATSAQALNQPQTRRRVSNQPAVGPEFRRQLAIGGLLLAGCVGYLLYANLTAKPDPEEAALAANEAAAEKAAVAKSAPAAVAAQTVLETKAKQAADAKMRERDQRAKPRAAQPIWPAGYEDLANAPSSAEAKGRGERLLSAFEEVVKPDQRKDLIQALVESGDWVDTALNSAIPKASPVGITGMLDVCSKRKATKCVPGLLERARKDGAATSGILFDTLGALNTPDAHNFLVKNIQNPDAGLRAYAWSALALNPNSKDIALLDAEFKKLAPTPAAFDALSAMARYGETEHQFELQRKIEAILDGAFAQDATVEAQIPFARALSTMPPQAYERYLQNLLRSENPTLRQWAVKGFAQQDSSVGALKPLLKTEKNAQVQQALADAFTEHPLFDATSDLVRLLEPNVSVAAQQKARLALIAAFGQDQGPQAALWNTWLIQGQNSGDTGRRKAFDAQRPKRLAYGR